MSDQYPKILLKMTTNLHDVFAMFENVLHPAAGKMVMAKKRKRSGTSPMSPKATPDSLNIRDVMKKEDGFRRNPAP